MLLSQVTSLHAFVERLSGATQCAPVLLNHLQNMSAGRKQIFDAIEKTNATVQKVVITSSIWCMLDLGALTLSDNMAVLTENDTNTTLDQEKGPAYIYAASKVCSSERTSSTECAVLAALCLLMFFLIS